MNSVDNRRRQFLARAAEGMVWLSAGSLSACGGSGGGDDAASAGGGGGGGGGGGATNLTPEQRSATLQAVKASVQGLATGKPSFDSAALVSALQATSGISRAGMAPATRTVWAQFTDGRYLVVPNNLEPGVAVGGSAPRMQAQAAPRAAAADGTKRRLASDFEKPSMLVAQQYRQLDMLGPVPTSASIEAAHLCADFVSDRTLPDLRKMAYGLGFTLPPEQVAQPPDMGYDNGLPGLASVGGDGVLFITGCGAQVGPEDAPRSAICTATPATAANLALYEADLARGTVVVAVTLRYAGNEWVPVPCLAITAAYVESRFWTFPPESVAILNLTGAPDLADWVQAFRRGNLRHVMGWRRPVSWQRLLAFGDDLIQLSLATNRLDGRLAAALREPRLRAYGLGETLTYLQRRGIAGAGGSDALAYYQEAEPALYVNTLLPTIDHVTIRENNLDIELVGQFGRAAAGTPLGRRPDQPENTDMSPQVLVGTDAVTRPTEPLLARAAEPLLARREALRDPSWPGDLLPTRLEPSQLERGGYVQVVNGGRCSNAVPITHWEIPFRAITTIDELTLDLTVTVRLRADVHAWRMEPDAWPRKGNPQVSLAGSVHCSARYTASGSIQHYDASSHTRTTITWSGSGGFANALGGFVINFSAQLLWDNRRTLVASLTVQEQGRTHQQQKVVEEFDTNGELLRRTETNDAMPVSLAAAGPGVSGELVFSFDDEWRLLGGSFDMLPEDSSILPAPPQRVMRTRLSWPTVTPDYPPLKDFGGT